MLINCITQGICKMHQKNHIDKLNNEILNLNSYKGISSGEYNIAQYLIERLSGLCDDVYIDKSGNVIGQINSLKKNAKTIMLEAHMDIIGLMVTGIEEDGSVRFTNVGGIDERILPFCEVTICAKENISGIIYQVGDEKDKKIEIDKMRIDTGFSYSYLVKHVSIGDLCYIKSDFSNLYGTLVSDSAMDNHAGIASILNAIELVDRNKLKYNIAVLFAVEEELGLHGAYAGSKEVCADAAIVVDVTHGSTADTKNETGVFSLGCGAVICRGPNFHYAYTNKLIDLAKELSIPYEIEVASGPSGTDAWAIQISGRGTPTMLVSIPLRYMHTNVETLDLCDVLSVSKIICAVLEGGIEIA